VLALLLISPLLGLDNFAAAASIGLSSPSWRTCLRVCAVFGAYAAVAPLAGLVLGESIARAIGENGRFVGGGILIALGLSGLISARRTATREQSDTGCYTMRALLSIGLAVSTDTFVAGFGLGLYGVETFLAVGVMAVTTMLMSLGGFLLARSIGSRLKTPGDQFSSAALVLVGAALAAKLI
jgi:putative Mn2+ efflux pump MntP